MYWGNVLNLGFCAGLPHLRQAFSVACHFEKQTKIPKHSQKIRNFAKTKKETNGLTRI
jgi:hypothetical protein